MVLCTAGFGVTSQSSDNDHLLFDECPQGQSAFHFEIVATPKWKLWLEFHKQQCSSIQHGCIGENDGCRCGYGYRWSIWIRLTGLRGREQWSLGNLVLAQPLKAALGASCLIPLYLRMLDKANATFAYGVRVGTGPS